MTKFKHQIAIWELAFSVLCFDKRKSNSSLQYKVLEFPSPSFHEHLFIFLLAEIVILPQSVGVSLSVGKLSFALHCVIF